MERLSEKFNGMLNKCLAYADALQTWPMYYRYRHLEITRAVLRSNIKHANKLLDIGCGNSFSSALLSAIANAVVGTDLPENNPDSHSVGLAVAKSLQEKTGAKVSIVGSVGEALPFKSAEFDAVFSMYVLEHVKSKKKAVDEMFRVLKANGTAVLIVPNATERIYAIPYYYLHAFKWILKRILGKHVKTTAKEHMVRYGKFLTPPPHGDYTNSMQEFLAHRKKEWLRLLSGKFRVERLFAGMVYPFDFANELLGFKAGYLLFSLLNRFFTGIENIIGEEISIPFANSLCIIARKE